MSEAAVAYERGFPANLDAERFVLAAFLTWPETFTAHELEADDFSLDVNRRIFAGLGALVAEGREIGRVELVDYLMARNQLELIGGFTYLISLEDAIPQAFNVESYVGILRDKKTLRRAILALERASVACYTGRETPETILSGVQAIISDLNANLRERQSLQSVEEIITAAGGLDDFLSPERKMAGGIKPPWMALAGLVPVMSPGEVSVFAGLPGFGKTALACDIATAGALQGSGVACFSLEMSGAEYLRRMLASTSSVNMFRHFRGHSTDDDRLALRDGINTLAAAPLFIDGKTGTSMPRIHSAVQRLQARQAVGLVVIDFAQLVEGQGDTRAQEVSGIARAAKLLASDLGVHVILLSQLSREGEKAWLAKESPEMRFLKESAGIGESANLVAVIWPDLDQMRNAAEINDHVSVIDSYLHIIKQRNGPTGTIKLRFNRQYTRFEE